MFFRDKKPGMPKVRDLMPYLAILIVIIAILNNTPVWVFYAFFIGIILLFIYFYASISGSGNSYGDDDDFEDDYDEAWKIKRQKRKKEYTQSPYFLNSGENPAEWANSLLRSKADYLIVDTETTGIGKKDEIIEIGIISLDGDTVFHSYVKPPRKKKMPPEAEKVHGISINFLKDKPTMKEIFPQLINAISNKILIAYNAEFDSRVINQTLDKYKLPPVLNKWQCAMLVYSKFVGQWNDYRQEYKWQKLPGAGHDTLSDCHAVKRIIFQMASR